MKIETKRKEILKEEVRQETLRKNAEEKRLAEIKAQINAAEQQLEAQEVIYMENANKIFGAGARLKKSARAECERLEGIIYNLKRQLK